MMMGVILSNAETQDIKSQIVARPYSAGLKYRSALQGAVTKSSVART